MLNLVVLRYLRRIRKDIFNMADEIAHLTIAAAALKASADRADANIEKVLTKVADLKVQLDAALAAQDLTAVQAVADQLGAVSQGLDAESAKVEALDAPPAPPAPTA